jgi:hypothetical protein
MPTQARAWRSSPHKLLEHRMTFRKVCEDPVVVSWFISGSKERLIGS